MTTREHLRGLHERAAEHHVRMGKIHQAALKKSSAMEDGSEDFHKAAIAEHAAMAEQDLQCCKDLSGATKAMNDDELVPDRISAIYKTDNIRGVPRHGQPSNIEINKIDPVFQNLLKVDE
jgi:hypothetical protein